MQVEIKIDDSYTEPKIIILTALVTEEVNDVIKKLSENNPQIISGSKNGKIEVLEQNDLFKLYAGSGKVFAVTNNGEYTLRLRLYEVEERLSSSQFVRISNSEIINLKKKIFVQYIRISNWIINRISDNDHYFSDMGKWLLFSVCT